MVTIPTRPVDRSRSIDPAAFPVVTSFSLDQEVCEERIELSLRLVLRSTSSQDDRRLHLTFHGVRELKFDQPEWSVFNLPKIEILTVHDRQWEKLNYLVREAENDILSFYCNGYEASVS